ncbi:MAG: hypothetical protein AAF696_01965 [Bacteroidota bacterium]
MSRRKNQVFNLSFLDLVTGALGAVIFLFIITPKGGSSAPDVEQVVMYMDTTEMKLFGDLDDSLKMKRVGDTLFTVLVDYKNFPKPEPKKVEKPAEIPVPIAVRKPKVEAPPKVESEKPADKPMQPTKPKEVITVADGPKKAPLFTGDAPSVPCKVSFELSWLSSDDNVDFFVCKGDDCVFGGRKRNKNVGQWDSGKSRNRLFGNDLRTNQESVRQFDNIIPGEYRLYAQFKESKKDNKTVILKGLVYTKDNKNQQRGEVFTRTLPLGKNRVFLGRVFLKANGDYQFSKK